jgi:glycerol kinase
MGDTSGINALITTAFADGTTSILVVLAAVFALAGLVAAASAGIAWLRKTVKSS